VLECALDAGITHYDVARLYGFGQAEGILGKYLNGKRDRVTVATKFGLQPNTALGKSRRLVNMARWVAHRSAFVMKMAKRVLSKPGGAASAGMFDPKDAVASLEMSLRELGTDYVDLFLLHECTVSEANREDLMAFLEGEMKRGRVRAFGPATEYEKLEGDGALLPTAQRVLQFGSTSLHPNASKLRNVGGRAMITFGAAAEARVLAKIATDRPALVAKYRDRAGVDPTNVGVLAGYLFREAVASIPAQTADGGGGGLVLFTSTSEERVRANVASVVDSRTSGASQAAFAEFAREAAGS